MAEADKASQQNPGWISMPDADWRAIGEEIAGLKSALEAERTRAGEAESEREALTAHLEDRERQLERAERERDELREDAEGYREALRRA